MVISHNISALNTYGALGRASKKTDRSMERLSSGYRINRAGDDAAGLSISEKMRAQIRGLNKATRNAEDGVSMIQTAEGALNETHSILQRMRELAVQAANDTNENLDREALQNEMNQLTSEINRIGNTTEFNNMKLLDGSKQSVREKDVVVAKGGTIAKFAGAEGITGDKFGSIVDGEITLGTKAGTVDLTKLQAATGKNTIKISRNATKDGFTVDIKLAEADTTTVTDPGINSLVVDSEAMVKNSDGSFIYDEHGISFSISKEEATKMFASTETDVDIEVDLFEYKGSPATSVNIAGEKVQIGNDYTEKSENIDISELKLDEYGSRLDFSSVNIEATATSDEKGTLKVEFLDEEGGVLVTETIETDKLKADATGTFTYKGNGVEFKVSVKDTSVVGDVTKLGVDVDKRFGAKLGESGEIKEEKAAYFHVGANKDQTISMEFGDMRAAALGIVSRVSGAEGFTSEKAVTNGTDSTAVEYGLNISTREGANSAIDVINQAIDTVSQERSKYGAVQNRLEYTVNNLQTAAENMQAAESRIRDVDMASEMMEMTKNSILQQAAQAMLIQANQRPQQALQLLQ